MSGELGDRSPDGSGSRPAAIPPRVFTLGYQGRSVPEVLQIVQEHGIEQVLDVRENARSRKPGFSSSELEGAFQNEGIGYVHLPELGCDRESRHALWRGAPTVEFLDRYRRKVGEPGAPLVDLLRRVQGSRTLLLCLERDASQCHRAVLGAELSAQGCLVEDL